MKWDEIRSKYPNQWLVVEAINAITEPNGIRKISDFVVLEQCSDGISAFNKYREYHNKNSFLEYYFLHTSKENIDIVEEKWIGIRVPSATAA